MFLTKALGASLLVCAATAQLIVGSAFRDLREEARNQASERLVTDYSREQFPLTGGHISGPSSSADVPPFKAGQFTLTPQSNKTCATYGESQWTGTVDVTDERRLFFWFFDSRNDPENDPVILWLNGGPGGTSMMGLLTEMGPCWLEPEANATIPNEWSWNQNASVLFIDQPAGVGFSSVAEGAPIPNSDMDGAQDFQVFLNIFFGQVFPDRAHLPIHFAAESYGGHYAPTYVKHILDSRRYDSKHAFRGNITSLILVDALIDFTSITIGYYEILCSQFRQGDSKGENVLNKTMCEEIRLAVPELERLGRSCDLSYDGHGCRAVPEYGERVEEIYLELVDAGERNPYNIHLPCNDPPMCADPNKGNLTHYLNQPHILAALNFPPSTTFSAINFQLNSAYSESGSEFKPTSREIGAILDAYRAPGSLGDIRILVLQGNDDVACNTPGNMWVWDKMLWSGHADYRMAKWEELPEGIEATGFWKATEDGRLAFVAVDGSGHTVPGDVRQGSYQIVQKWIDEEWHM